MKKSGRDRRPYVKPVTRIELPQINVKARVILLVVFLAIGVVALITGMMSMLSTEPGWQQIEVNPQERNCSGDFVFYYDFTDSDSATAEHKQLNNLYSQLTTSAYQIFTADEQISDVGNVYTLNAHVNEIVTVDPVLYQALELLVSSGSRYPFLAPVNVEYNRVFIAENDDEAARYDPIKSPQLQPYIRQTASYAADPDMVSLELMGNNQARLNVAQEYLDYGRENEIETYFDFDWMKNAFIVDYMAQQLQSQGFTKGYLASYDGFTRNLDSRGVEYGVNVLHLQGVDLYQPAQLIYDTPMSIVNLRSYAMSDLDRWHYYSYASGETLTIFLDPADGMSKSSIDTLTCYSESMGCAQILMEAAPVFIADAFSEERLLDMAGENVYSVWCRGAVVRHTDPKDRIALVSDGGLVYTIEQALAS